MIYYRERLDGLLKNYYKENNSLVQPLNRALFYSRRRLRAILAYCGCGTIGGIPESADWVAMLYEIITSNSVLIDDSIIFDAGKERAHLPTPRIQYGEVAALLSACVLQLEPVLLLAGRDSEHSKIFYQSARDTVLGGVAEHELSIIPAGEVVDEQQILKTSRLLTGSLLAGAISSGAIVAGGTAEQIEALQAYAMDFGTAYQISDHIVDITVQSEKSGKDNFSDIRTGKKTIVLNYALQNLPVDSPERAIITNALGSTPSLETQAKIKQIFHQTGAIQHCLNLILSYNAKAVAHLQHLPDNQYRSLLVQIPEIYLEQLLTSLN